MTLDDLKRVRGSALLALAMAIAGAAAILASNGLAADAGQAHRTALDARSTAQAGLLAARAEEAEISQKIDRYSGLAARGAIGAEQRLAWVELIRDARARHRLGALDYEFAPQRLLDATVAPAEAGQLEVASSALRIRLPLLHEGDLLTLLDELTRNAPALVRVRECSIARRTATEAGPGNAGAETLQADCLLEWITFRPRTGAGS